MVSVIWRAVVSGFGSTTKPTVPSPVPLSPVMMMAQKSLLTAVHGHEAVTATVPDAPVCEKVRLVGLMEKVHWSATSRTAKPELWPVAEFLSSFALASDFASRAFKSSPDRLADAAALAVSTTLHNATIAR